MKDESRRQSMACSNAVRLRRRPPLVPKPLVSCQWRASGAKRGLPFEKSIGREQAFCKARSVGFQHLRAASARTLSVASDAHLMVLGLLSNKRHLLSPEKRFQRPATAPCLSGMGVGGDVVCCQAPYSWLSSLSLRFRSQARSPLSNY